MISLLLPSRGRPSNVARLHESVASTAQGPWEMVIRLDDDDPTMDDYPDGIGIRYLTGTRGLMSDMWNECWRAARGSIFGLLGDDIIVRTHAWDLLVTDAFPADGIAYVHGDDLGGKGDQLGTHGFVTETWTDAVGVFSPPYFSSDYNDLWLNDIADAIGRRVFLPGLVTEHCHPAFDKADWDQTHLERVERHHRDDVDRTWRETAHIRDEWADQLRSVMQ